MTYLLQIFLLLLFAFSPLTADNAVLEELLMLNNERAYADVKLSTDLLTYIDKVRVDGSYKHEIDGTNQQNYSLRVYPKDFKTYAFEKKHLYSEQAYVNTQMDREQLLLQEKNYAFLANAKFQKKHMQFLEKTIELYKNELKIKKELMSGRFYVESIFFINNKIQLLTLKYLKQKQLYENSIKTIESILNHHYSFLEIERAIENYDLYNAQEIIAKIEEVDFEILRDESIDVQVDKQKIQIAQEKVKLESLKEKFSFDFFELGAVNKQFQGNSISFGLGIDLPLKKSNQVKILEGKLALTELRAKEKVDDVEYRREVQFMLSSIKTLFNYKNGLEEVLANDTFYNLYATKEDADPRFVLELQERTLDSEEEVLMVEEKIHQLYVAVLQATHAFNHPILSPLVKGVE